MSYTVHWRALGLLKWPGCSAVNEMHNVLCTGAQREFERQGEW